MRRVRPGFHFACNLSDNAVRAAALLARENFLFKTKDPGAPVKTIGFGLSKVRGVGLLCDHYT
jgi:hypothetical protein